MKYEKTFLTVMFIAVGFLGAAAFYWRWWPAYSPSYGAFSQLACPTCPHVDGIGSNLQKFVSRTAVFGGLNAALFTVLGWAAVGTIRLVKRHVS